MGSKAGNPAISTGVATKRLNQGLNVFAEVEAVSAAANISHGAPSLRQVASCVFRPVGYFVNLSRARKPEKVMRASARRFSDRMLRGIAQVAV